MRKTPMTNTQLGSLLERDETPEAGSQSTIDEVLSTPNGPLETSLRDRIAQLSNINTPKTVPRTAHAEMHPKSAHQTTNTDAPNSAFRLGFADLDSRRSIASLQNSPTKSQSRQSLPQHMTSAAFEFKFASSTKLSNEAQQLMENVREDAARIKAQMVAEKEEQDRKDNEADDLFGGLSAAGRKIAKPRGKAGRFSDVHMEQFKKMDSIADHPSSYRARPGFAQPTQQSLKRNGSTAGLDEPERPRTAGKGTPGKAAPPFMRQASASPFKSIQPTNAFSEKLENASAKRMRRSEFGDVSTGKTVTSSHDDSAKPSTLPRPKPAVPNSIHTPTAASLARSTSTKIPLLSPDKRSQLPRSNSVRSLKDIFEAVRAETVESPAPPTHTVSKLPRSGSMKSLRPLPPIPTSVSAGHTADNPLSRSPSTKTLSLATPKTGLSSRLPTFAGLKSILRSSRPGQSKSVSTSSAREQAGGTPKRVNTNVSAPESAKKVDFTPSVKSRYAVKLATGSPSPNKLSRRDEDDPSSSSLGVPYDTTAYMVDDLENKDAEDWDDDDIEVAYPTLPSLSPGTLPPPVKTFLEKAKHHNRRESKEFKSIFTTLEHPSRSNPRPDAVTLTDVNTTVNKIDPINYANKIVRSPSNTLLAKPSPSTIRRVRTSGVPEPIRPFEDTIKTVPHGLPGKKRRRESDKNQDQLDAGEDSKENRKLSVMPQVPGGWDDAELNEDEGEKRGGKRARVAQPELESPQKKAENKKPNAARVTAAKNAKERKGKGILSLSRLNALARPKERK